MRVYARRHCTGREAGQLARQTGSASRRDDTLAITFVNPKHETSTNVSCDITGARPNSAEARIPHHPGFNAQNGWENPDRIVPRKRRVEIETATLKLT